MFSNEYWSRFESAMQKFVDNNGIEWTLMANCLYCASEVMPMKDFIEKCTDHEDHQIVCQCPKCEDDLSLNDIYEMWQC